MKRFLLIVLFALASTSLHAQYSAVRINLLPLAVGVVEAGVDLAIAERHSMDVAAAWSPQLGSSYAVSVGVRVWRFEPHVGWFVGSNATYSEFDIDGSVGWLAGVGASLGHSWIISRRWNFSVEAGVGLSYLEDSVVLDDTSPLEDLTLHTRRRIMLCPSRMEASFSYLF